jgi:DNA-binding transcriptional ArsR family regulator
MIELEMIPLAAQRFKALGEPARLSLLAALQHGEQSVSDLVKKTGRGQPNVSQHLAYLIHAGLVAPRRDGNHVYYRISDPYVMRICDAVCKSIGATQHVGIRRQSGQPRRSLKPRVREVSRA